MVGFTGLSVASCPGPAGWVAFWNFRRLHAATGYLPPAEYERAYLRRQAEPIAAA